MIITINPNISKKSKCLSIFRQRLNMSKTESVCMHVFLDVDGVMADFNKVAIKELGMHPRVRKTSWTRFVLEKIYAVDNFSLN